MKVGIIGSAAVGQTLARAFTSEGHDAVLGSRNSDTTELDDFKSKNPSIPVANFEATAAGAEMIIVATAGAAAEEAIRMAGLHNFTNKIVIDTTNPIDKTPPENGVAGIHTRLLRSRSYNQRCYKHGAALQPASAFK